MPGKIYILRHEQRPLDNATYFVSLTEQGLINSENLIDKIDTLKIDTIYCSPFLRTIQTILPYCREFNKKLNMEYSLYEYIDPTVFNSYTFKHTHDELYELYKDIPGFLDESYESFLNVDDLNYKENIRGCFIRTSKFIKHLQMQNNDKNILLVSHGTPLAIIKKLVEEHKEYTIEDEKLAIYPYMGELYKLQNEL